MSFILQAWLYSQETQLSLKIAPKRTYELIFETISAILTANL